MFPWVDLQTDCAEEIITTYQSDFRPMKERQPWPRIRPGVRPAPGFTGSCQAKCETQSVFFQHLYKTTNSSCSLDVGSQHPSGSLFPTFLPSFSSAPAFSEAAVSSTLREASVQEAGVAKETGLGVGNTVNMLEQLEPKDGFQYQEGVILLDADTFSCEDVLRILGKEAGPQFLLSRSVVSGLIKGPGQNKGVSNFLVLETENWQNHLRDWSPVRTFSCCEWTPGCPAGDLETQDVPPPSCLISQPLVCGQQRHTRTRPGRERTEYRDRFGAQWVQPQNQTSFSSSNMNLYPSI